MAENIHLSASRCFALALSLYASATCSVATSQSREFYEQKMIESITQGCEKGANEGSAAAIKMSTAVIFLLETTEPNSKARLQGLETIKDTVEKIKDNLYLWVKDETRKMDRTIDSRSDIGSDLAGIIKSHYRLRLQAHEIAYMSAVRTAMKNGLDSEGKKSQIYYQRTAENECLGSFSSTR